MTSSSMDLSRIKSTALLAFLAVEADRPHRRSMLAGLLWPEFSEKAARASLRNALANLRQSIQDAYAHPPYLLVDNETLQFNTASDFWLDASQFEQSISRREKPPLDEQEGIIVKLQSAASLYQGRFLHGFSLKDSPEFDEWVLMKQEYYQRQALTVLADLANFFEKQGNFTQASEYAQRVVFLEPWHEEAHRQLMRLLALSGKRKLALAQFEATRQSLEDELGLLPDGETVQLYEKIRDGELRGAAEVKIPLHNLPAMLTSLIGREKELENLLQRLSDPGCRLLTLVGSGGSGKTRLALEAALRCLTHFTNGVFYVPLAGVRYINSVPQALAQALSFSFQADSNPGSNCWISCKTRKC